MESTISATYLAKNLSDVLTRVKDRGERFVIQRDGETIATITAASKPSGITVAELVARIGNLPIPDDDFADDLERIQADGSPAPRSKRPRYDSR